MDGETARFSYRDDPGPTGAVRIIDAAEALQVLPQVYDTVCRDVPASSPATPMSGSLTRLADPEHWRRGAGPKFFAVIEFDGKPVGYAIYRIKSDWQDGFSTEPGQAGRGDRRVSGGDARALPVPLWDRPVAVCRRNRIDPGSPLFLMVADPRSLHLKC